ERNRSPRNLPYARRPVAVDIHHFIGAKANLQGSHSEAEKENRNKYGRDYAAPTTLEEIDGFRKTIIRKKPSHGESNQQPRERSFGSVRDRPDSPDSRLSNRRSRESHPPAERYPLDYPARRFRERSRARRSEEYCMGSAQSPK